MLNTKYVAIYDDRYMNYRWYIRTRSLLVEETDISVVSLTITTYKATGRILKREDGASAEIYENPIWLQSVLTAINNQNK